MTQCFAKTKDGSLCEIPAKTGQKYCHIHQRQKVLRQIFSGVSIGAIVLGILGFIANITGVLDYFDVKLTTPDVHRLSSEELQANGAFVKIETINPSPGSIFVEGSETPVIVTVTYNLPGNTIQPILALEYLISSKSNETRWYIAYEVPAEVGKHEIQLASTVKAPDLIQIYDDSFQIVVCLSVLDEDLGRREHVARDTISFDLVESK